MAATIRDVTAAFVWGVLFAVWTIWAWWPLPLGISTSLIAYRWWILPSAELYADLTEATFDIHRLALYGALR
jgi:hypothetical protein